MDKAHATCFICSGWNKMAEISKGQKVPFAIIGPASTGWQGWRDDRASEHRTARLAQMVEYKVIKKAEMGG